MKLAWRLQHAMRQRTQPLHVQPRKLQLWLRSATMPKCASLSARQRVHRCGLQLHVHIGILARVTIAW